MRFSDRDRDYRNYQKANYFQQKQDEEPYWTEDYQNEVRRPNRNYGDTVKIILTYGELKKIIFNQVMDAQKLLMDAIFPRFRKIDDGINKLDEGQSTIYKLVDQLVEDDREILKEIDELNKKN